MSRIGRISTLAFGCIFLTGGAIWAQSSESARDAWLMKNYRFTGPPPPGSVRPTDPVVSDLQRIQDTLMTIMRTARFSGDFDFALAAAAQAAQNAQLLGSIQERLAAAEAARAAMAEAKADGPAQLYFIAFKDHTIETATRYWSDRMMIHYMTPHGAHVQVRLELVDRDLSVRLNRERNLEFSLPQ